MLRLVIEDDDGKTTVVPLIRDEITIGRKEGNTIRLTERNVSRHHARLVRSGGAPSMVFVEDLESFNGVRLNGERIADKATLKVGDLIQIGDYALALKDDAPEEHAEKPAAIDRAATAVHQVEALSDTQKGKLVVVSSNLAGETYALDRREVIIGRTDENDIVVNHRSISRNHAKIIFRDDAFTIIDLASSNGVKVNGEVYGTASLVKGDIVELGQVKMRYVAPGDDYVFTPADVEDAEVRQGPGVGRLVFIGIILAAVAVGTFFIVDRKGTGGSAGGETPSVRPEAVDVSALEAEGKTAMSQEQWEEATRVFGRLLQAKPEHDEAQRLHKRALAEGANQRRYNLVLKDVEENQWADAFFGLRDFPLDSLYTTKLGVYRPRIELGFATAELERGLRLVNDANLEGARKVLEALQQHPFASEQATRLAAAIRDAEQVAVRPPPEAPPTVAVASEPRRVPDEPVERPVRPDRPERPERPERPVRPPPEAAPTVDPEAAYSEVMEASGRLIAQGRREEAVGQLLKAHRLNPNSHMPHQRLCAILPFLGRTADSLTHCKLWRAKEPNPAYRIKADSMIQQLEAELNP
jgi:pSer/pThr/pTyr-binding forkhead associated (FHA) protein